VRVVAATGVTVLATVQVISSQATDAIEPLVRTALSGFAAQAPGKPLYAAQVLSAVTAVSGVVAAEIVGWERLGNATTTATSLGAARATWGAQTSAPTGAELLSIDGSAQRLTIEVVAPGS
jgi:hypothetical protein